MRGKERKKVEVEKGEKNGKEEGEKEGSEGGKGEEKSGFPWDRTRVH